MIKSSCWFLLICLSCAAQTRAGLEFGSNEVSRHTVVVDGQTAFARVGFGLSLPAGMRPNHFADLRRRDGDVEHVTCKLGEPMRMPVNYVGVHQSVATAGGRLKSDFELVIHGALPLTRLDLHGQAPAGHAAGRWLWFVSHPDRPRLDWGLFPERLDETSLFISAPGNAPNAFGCVTDSGRGFRVTLAGPLWKGVFVSDARKWSDAFVLGAAIADGPLPEGTRLAGSYAIEPFNLADLQACTDEYPAILAKLEASRARHARRSAIAERVQAVLPGVATGPRIDGKLDDPCWEEAAILAPFVRTDGLLPGQATLVRAVHDSAALHLAFVCLESDMAKLVTRHCTTDECANPWQDDCVEVFIDSRKDAGKGHGLLPYYHFTLTAAGRRTDIEHLLPMGRRLNRAWSSGWEAAVTRGADRWTAEIRIPVVRMLRGADMLHSGFGVNLARSRMSDGEYSSWPGSSGTLPFHRRAQFGRLRPAADAPVVTAISMAMPRAGANTLRFATRRPGKGRLLLEVASGGVRRLFEEDWQDAGGELHYSLPANRQCGIRFNVTCEDRLTYGSAKFLCTPRAASGEARAVYGDGAPWQPVLPRAAEKEERGRFSSDQSRMTPFELAPLAADLTGTALDFSFLLDPPAGKHGFVKAKAGRFVFEDGTRARFWGVTFGGGKSIYMSREQAEAMARHLAQSGFNMVRIGPVGIPPTHTRGGLPQSVVERHGGGVRFHSGNLDALDYLVAQLKRRGVYIHLDLMVGAEFAERDGVVQEPGESAHRVNGAAVFDPHMIELQQQFATALLNHRNPYTGLAWKDDPVFATLSLMGERSVVAYEGFTPHYLAEFRQFWNRWLLQKYGSREALKRTWTDRLGVCDLKPRQDPAKGAVPLPVIARVTTWDRPYTTGMFKTDEHTPDEVEYYVKYYSRMGSQGIPSTNDMLRFCHDLQVDYECGMREFLRGLGAKMPIMGARAMRLPASLKAKARMDFVETHNYWGLTKCRPGLLCNPNLPMVRADPFDCAYDKASTVGPLAGCRVWGLPLANIEWSHVFPNEFRAEGPLLMSGYACLQDWDLCLYHGYVYEHQGFTLNCVKGWATFPDPAQIGPLRLATLLFRRNDVSTARNKLAVGYSDVGAFYHQCWKHSNVLNPSDWAVALAGVGTTFFQTRYEGDADVVFASGFSAAASYADAKHAIVVADNPWDNLYNHGEPDRLRPLREINPALRFRQGVETTWSFEQLGLAEPLAGRAVHAIQTASLPAGAVPFGVSADGALCLGYVGARFCLIADARLPLSRFRTFLYRVFIKAARLWGLPGSEHLDPDALVSDTGELRWDYGAGMFTVDTPRTKAVVGFAAGRPLDLGGLSIRLRNPFCTVALTTLDGEPLATAARMLLVAVGKVENTGQYWLNRSRTEMDGKRHIGVGRAPVLIDPITGALALARDPNAPPLSVYALDGAGRRQDQVSADTAAGRLRFEIGRRHQTIYYEITDAPPGAR